VQAVGCAARSQSLSEEQAFSWLKIPKRTPARRKSGKARLHEVKSERLLRLARVAATASAVLGTREKAVGWMTKPMRALGGDSPMHLLDKDVGFHQQGRHVGTVVDVLIEPAALAVRWPPFASNEPDRVDIEAQAAGTPLVADQGIEHVGLAVAQLLALLAVRVLVEQKAEIRGGAVVG
jgi:putative toxin-antitoxin system antitoxin component (TIGR02293 family)